MFRFDTLRLKRAARLAVYPMIVVLHWVGLVVVLLLLPVSCLVLEIAALMRRLPARARGSLSRVGARPCGGPEARGASDRRAGGPDSRTRPH